MDGTVTSENDTKITFMHALDGRGTFCTYIVVSIGGPFEIENAVSSIGTVKLV